MQQYDDGQSQYVRRPTHQRLSHAQRQDDGGGYPEESAESPGPSVSEVMAMQARTERRPRKSHRQDSHPPSQQYEGHSRHDSVDHSHASSSRKKQSSRSAAADLRCLTLLIEDKRFHPPENLLTEVHVRLRETADGHWADAKDICDELQFGPSRIDGRYSYALSGLHLTKYQGPAKVYAMRGKYKQYWLRVTAEGGNDCTPVNLKVTPQRTLEVFIEHVSDLQFLWLLVLILAVVPFKYCGHPGGCLTGTLPDAYTGDGDGPVFAFTRDSRSSASLSISPGTISLAPL